MKDLAKSQMESIAAVTKTFSFWAVIFIAVVVAVIWIHFAYWRNAIYPILRSSCFGCMFRLYRFSIRRISNRCAYAYGNGLEPVYGRYGQHKGISLSRFAANRIPLWNGVRYGRHLLRSNCFGCMFRLYRFGIRRISNRCVYRSCHTQDRYCRSNLFLNHYSTLGIMKSMGYTSRDLMIQLTLRILPVTIISSCIAAVLSVPLRICPLSRNGCCFRWLSYLLFLWHSQYR